MIEKTGPERRRSPRVWLRTPGHLIIVKSMRSTSTVACKVLNTSSGGALLKVDCGVAEIPDDFYLTISGKQERKFICSVVRRGQKLLGVRFVPQPDYNVTLRGSPLSNAGV